MPAPCTSSCARDDDWMIGSVLGILVGLLLLTGTVVLVVDEKISEAGQ